MLKTILLCTIYIATISTSFFYSNAYAANHTSKFGNAASSSSAQRTVKLDQNSKYINVTQGETITFVFEGNSFTWNFDTFGTPVFNLKDIAPKNINTQNIIIYTREDPTFTGM